jgi:putative tryptophan/tyrosine transport system substrate-binding protein
MNRREFVTAIGLALVSPAPARAQQKAIPAVGFLSSRSADESTPYADAFRQGLSDTGFVDGRSVAIEYRWAEGRYDRLPAMAAGLVARKVDLIATGGSAPSALAAQKVTSTIPIVFSVGVDPVAVGLVASLSRPGANITGISVLGVELEPKRLELLSEVVPQAKVIALLVNPTSPVFDPGSSDMQKAARAKGLQLQIVRAGSESEIDAAFASFAELRVGGLVVSNDPFFAERRDQLARLTARYAVPSIHLWREFAEAGGLMSYGPNLPAVYRQQGVYAGRILNGEKPADLPVEQSSKFELVINLKTAKALGLTVPQSLLARADEVIE